VEYTQARRARKFQHITNMAAAILLPRNGYCKLLTKSHIVALLSASPSRLITSTEKYVLTSSPLLNSLPNTQRCAMRKLATFATIKPSVFAISRWTISNSNQVMPKSTIAVMIPTKPYFTTLARKCICLIPWQKTQIRLNILNALQPHCHPHQPIRNPRRRTLRLSQPRMCCGRGMCDGGFGVA
jgi:hypothetical protein